jgi:hypothetical protein
MKQSQQSKWQTSPKQLSPSDTRIKCIRISSGGVYFWWQAGAAKYMQEHHDLSNISVVGSSAGALTATLLKTKGCFNSAAALAIELVDRHNIRSNPLGLAGIWGSAVEEWLNQLIPHDLSPSHLEDIHIAATPINPLLPPTTLTNFADRNMLIRACLTSTHIPFFMNGQFCTCYDGSHYMDGSFWSCLGNLWHKEAWPDRFERLHPDEVFHLDWQNDLEFRKMFRTTTAVSLLSPEGLHNMMNAGYAYMERLAASGQLRLPPKKID